MRSKDSPLRPLKLKEKLIKVIYTNSDRLFKLSMFTLKVAYAALILRLVLGI